MQDIACDGKRESGERPASGGERGDSGDEPQRGTSVTRDGKRLPCGCTARLRAAAHSGGRVNAHCASAAMETSGIYKKTARVERGREEGGYLTAQFAASAVVPSTAATAPAAAMISAASGEVA